MISYRTSAFIENKTFGEVEIFLNSSGEVIFTPNDESDQFLLVMDKYDWEEIKAFIDKKFSEHEAA